MCGKKCHAGTWGTDHTACFKFVGDDWKNCDCVHAGSDARIYRCYCGGTTGMVYYGESGSLIESHENEFHGIIAYDIFENVVHK